MDKAGLMPEMFENPTGEWERVADTCDRLKVDGGYIYRIMFQGDVACCFVPDVDLQRYQAHLRDAYNKGLEDGAYQALKGQVEEELEELKNAK